MPHRLTVLGKAAFYRTKQLCHVPACSHLVSRHHNATVSKSLEGQTIRIGCASGFWGDTAVSGMTREVTHEKKSPGRFGPRHFEQNGIDFVVEYLQLVGNKKHVDDPFQVEDLVQDTQTVDLDTSLTLVKSNLQHTTVDKTVELCLDFSVAQTNSDALPVRSKAPLKSKDPKNVSKSRTKVGSAASGEPVISGLDPQQSETFLGPPMEHGKNSNASQTMQHVNKIDSESGHAKAKKPTSRSQSKVKHDPHELAQVNKQQADCISDLERRLNEMDQFNQILQKLDLSKHSDNITGSSGSHSSVPSQENYMECENRNDRKTEMKDPHCMEAGVVVPPLIYQEYINDR